MRIVDDLAALPRELDALGARRVLVLATPGRRFVDRLDLGGRDVAVFDKAQVHVPRDVVDAAEAALVEARADTVISVGGGSATGLAKALRLRRDVRFVAIPTTWSGSEMTRIWGTTMGGKKETGRDDRVRPDVVVHAPELFRSMPRRLAVTSLLNALAHPISALSTGTLDEELAAQSLEAVRHLGWALDHLLEGASAEGHAEALHGMRLGADVLDRAPMGAHHKVAHLLGGAFGLEHGALHAVLLPHSVRRLLADPARADVGAAIAPDAPAHLYDALVRVGAPRSLIGLGADPGRLAALRGEHEAMRAAWVDDAVVGRRPSVRERRVVVGGQEVSAYGPEPTAARRVVVALHGRGSDAGTIAKRVDEVTGHDPTVAILAPQAPDGAWYPLAYRKSLAEHGAAVPDVIGRVDALLAGVLAQVPPDRVVLFGFSQGACLAAEVFARTEAPLAGLIAPAGARVGSGDHPPIRRDLHGSFALLGAAAADPYLDAADIEATAAAFRAAGATVDLVAGPGDAHVITALQRIAARRLVGAPPPPPLVGFANVLESEALPGALPRHQNTPRPAPYGLFGEHVSGTGFTAVRADNRKLWTYRIRPSAQHAPFAPLAHPTFAAQWGPSDPNLCAWGPLDLPAEPADFVDGLVTLGGAGSPGERRGFAVHLYAANRSMDDRAFCDADGDLLIVPWQGALTLLTEAGVLEVPVGHVAVVPRGLRFSVLVPEGTARGYVAETYGPSFRLPERGPVGANSLADPRHFRAPHAWFEDRIAPGYRVATKHDNALYEATQDHSPYDVVAWSGNHLPWVYDLMDFSPVGNTRVDHVDPSIHTVLHAPLDEPGASALDFVVFVPRWDASEHTFRPPYFHRNVTTEINGIVSDPSLPPDGPFHPGCTFVTPSLTPHGVRTGSVERALKGNDRATRIPEGSLWFQFETALPLHLTAWARAARIADWPLVWGPYRPHFAP